jgi:hypothetical protein
MANTYGEHSKRCKKQGTAILLYFNVLRHTADMDSYGQTVLDSTRIVELKCDQTIKSVTEPSKWNMKKSSSDC